MSSGSGLCPRCSAALAPAQIDDIAVRLCGACRGVWVAHADLTRILEASWRAIPATVAATTAFHAPVLPEAAALVCPDCRQPMEQYGYLGLRAVTIDRCDGCAHLWLDADELQNMVLALAKTNYRRESAAAAARRATLDYTTAAIPLAAPPAARASSWLFDQTGEAGEVVLAQLLLRLLLRR